MNKAKVKEVMDALLELDFIPTPFKDAQGDYSVVIQDNQGVGVNQVKNFADTHAVNAVAKLIILN